MIPVMGVPILNNPALLDRLIASIDVPVDRIVIVDNGDVVDPESYPTDCVVIKPGHNIGVAASWNLIIKSTPQAPYWLIVNSDLAFGLGDLTRLEERITDQPGMFKMLGLAAFAVNQATIERVGFFDENFHPAYCEDIDFQHRADLTGVPHIEIGYTGTHVGSATIRGDPHYMKENGRTYSENVRYYERKWGGPMNGGETFSTPFNQGGSVRDVPVDLSRIRSLAWSRAGGT